MTCLNLRGRRCLVVGAGPSGSRRSRACWPPRPTCTSSRWTRCPRSRSSRARARCSSSCAAIAATISRARSSSSRPPRTPSSTCGSSRRPRRGRCSSTSSTCRRSATSSCPAIARVGPISIAVSTRGASPALAKRLRTEIAERYGEPYAQLAEMLNDIRGWARDTLPTYQDRKVFFEAIVHGASRSHRAPARGRRAGRARSHRGHIRARGRECRCPLARERTSGCSSRAWPSARSARPSPCSARPIRRSSAPRRRRSGAPTPRPT